MILWESSRLCILFSFQIPQSSSWTDHSPFPVLFLQTPLLLSEQAGCVDSYPNADAFSKVHSQAVSVGNKERL